jgi:hypothetical protein
MSDQRQFIPGIGPVRSQRRWTALAAALLLASLVWARAELQGQRREGELQPFINPEAKDLDTKLVVLQQTLYEVDQKLTNLTFAQRYGDRIRMERVMFPTPDHELTPTAFFAREQP